MNTINDAIRAVLRRKGAPMTSAEVYDAIVAEGLYSFKAERPLHVVSGQIRRHSVGIDFPSAERVKHFRAVGDGKYELLPQPMQVASSSIRRRNRAVGEAVGALVRPTLDDVLRTHQDYLRQFRRRVLDELRSLKPDAFELFCRNLLSAYGFHDMVVTQVSRDGGVDGFGRLKVGFAFFNVAFQCKRWKGSVGRVEVDAFRGAIQGKYEQGIFFTTATFTHEAQEASFRLGAVPIVLVNGQTLVDVMLEKRFAVEVEEISLFRLALDAALVRSERS